MIALLHPLVVAQFAAGSESIGEFLIEAEDNKDRVLVSALAFAEWQPRDRVEMGRLRMLASTPPVEVVPARFHVESVAEMIEEPMRWAGATLAEVHTVRIMWEHPPGSLFVLPAVRPDLEVRTDPRLVAAHMPRSTRLLQLVDPPADTPPEQPR